MSHPNVVTCRSYGLLDRTGQEASGIASGLHLQEGMVSGYIAKLTDT